MPLSFETKPSDDLQLEDFEAFPIAPHGLGAHSSLHCVMDSSHAGCVDMNANLSQLKEAVAQNFGTLLTLH